ncbi:MAG: hypothetical protein QOI95_4436 [Acidimicrobiaceae bacterium]|jgi:hypothetical protein
MTAMQATSNDGVPQCWAAAHVIVRLAVTDVMEAE